MWVNEVRMCFQHTDAGVTAVALLDIDTRSVSVFRRNARPEVFRAADTLTLPDVLPGFGVPVARLFRH